jgi:hypothetical protein
MKATRVPVQSISQALIDLKSEPFVAAMQSQPGARYPVKKHMGRDQDAGHLGTKFPSGPSGNRDIYDG